MSKIARSSNGLLHNCITAFVGLFTAAAVAIAFSSPIRALSGRTMAMSVIGALPIAIFSSFGVYRLSWTLPARRLLSGLLILIVVLFQFYNGLASGLVNLGCADGGNHIYHWREFVQSNPSVYYGFVGFYGLMYWSSFLTADVFEALRLSIYLVFFAILALGLALQSGGQKKRVYIILWLVAGELIFFPLLHYLQADGFYSQLYGLSLLMLLWFLTAHGCGTIMMIGMLVLLRFGYGINLAEQALTVGLIILLSRGSWFRCVAAAGCCAIALLAWVNLIPVLQLPGSMVEPRFVFVMLGQACLVLQLMLAVLKGEPNLQTQRLVLFPCVFGALALFSQLVFFILDVASSYYLAKYGFYATFVLASASVIAFTVDIPRPVIRRAAFMLGSLGLLLLAISQKAYLPSFFERSFNRWHLHYNIPLSDREASAIITETLRKEGEKFGGLIIPLWPMWSFMTASFEGHPTHEAFKNGDLTTAPGYCVFWRSDKRALDQLQNRNLPHLVAKINELTRSGDQTTIPYKARWGRELELSYRCY